MKLAASVPAAKHEEPQKMIKRSIAFAITEIEAFVKASVNRMRIDFKVMRSTFARVDMEVIYDRFELGTLLQWREIDSLSRDHTNPVGVCNSPK